MTAVGRVHVQQEGVHVYADTIRYDLASQQLTAEGHVAWQQDGQEIQARSLTYNLSTRKGIAEEIRTTTPPWFYRGKEVILEPGVVRLKGARFSTCDYPLDYEHYHLKASSITVKPGRSFSARNVVLYMGKVPVFFLPVFGKDLRDRRMPFQFDTGSTEFLGRYGLITSNYLFSPANYGSMYVDYFQKKGFGFGLRHEIELNPFSVLGLYGYYQREKGVGDDRWEGMARGRWAFSSRLQGRIEALIPGDGWFSQQYYPARREALVSSQRQFDASATWSPKGYTLGVLWRRMESASYDPLRKFDFTRTLQVMPQVDLTFSPRPLVGRGGPLADFSAHLTRQWTQSNDFYQMLASAEGGLSKTVTPVKGQSLYGRAGLRASFQDKPNLGSTEKTGENRSMTSQASWTGRWFPSLSTSLGWYYDRKLIKLLPSEIAHHGVSQNQLNGTIEWNWRSRVVSRTATTYNLLTDVDSAGKRFSYLQQNLTIIPSRFFESLTMANFSMVAHELKDVSQVLTLRNSKDMWRFRLGFNYVDPRVTPLGMDPVMYPKSVNLTTDLSFVFFTNYRLSVLETYDVESANVTNRQANLYRDLHDWEAQFGYSRSEGSNKQVFFRLNLKAFPGRPLTVSESEMKRFTGSNASELVESTARQFQ